MSETKPIAKVFFHADLDAFFASVEQLDDLSLRGKPVIVGGLPTDRRSVVSTCSYEARRFGVHSAMPTARAVQLCPQGIFMRGHFHRYHEKSREVMQVFGEFSSDVQQLSVDEAFLDMSGTTRLFGPPAEAARKLKAAVREKTGLTVSIGTASNKYLAKIASGIQKPDGLTVVPPGGEEAFMLALPLEKLWGAGTKTQETLRRAGFRTTADVHKATESMLTTIFGPAGGRFLYRAVRGEAAEDFDGEAKSRSISAERTFTFDLTERNQIETALLDLCHTLMFRLIAEGQSSRTVGIKIRYGDFSTFGVRETLPRNITSIDELFEHVRSLFEKKCVPGLGIRLLGISLMNIHKGADDEQGELFDFDNSKKKQAIERSVLKLNKKFPKAAVKKARVLKSKVGD
jgi:DNA polymerase-4